jgi:hypothetical protein
MPALLSGSPREATAIGLDKRKAAIWHFILDLERPLCRRQRPGQAGREVRVRFPEIKKLRDQGS